MTELLRIKPLEWEWLTVNGIKFLNAVCHRESQLEALPVNNGLALKSLW